MSRPAAAGGVRLASIHIYPMKAARAVDLDESIVEPWGLAGDRRWLLVDEDGRDVAQGQAGEILSRGPDCFAGYTDAALTARAFDGGWYRSEDIGVLDADGYLSITDRKKDIIIRGGENISALEVEQLLA